jgi:hypothetical protein
MGNCNSVNNHKVHIYQQKLCIEIENNITDRYDIIREIINIIKCINYNTLNWNINNLSTNTIIYTTDLYNYDIRIILFDIMTDQPNYLLRMINLKTLRLHSKSRSKIEIPLSLIHNKEFIDIIHHLCIFDTIINDINIISTSNITHKLINRNSFLGNIFLKNDIKKT